MSTDCEPGECIAMITLLKQIACSLFHRYTCQYGLARRISNSTVNTAAIANVSIMVGDGGRAVGKFIRMADDRHGNCKLWRLWGVQNPRTPPLFIDLTRDPWESTPQSFTIFCRSQPTGIAILPWSTPFHLLIETMINAMINCFSVLPMVTNDAFPPLLRFANAD